MICFFFLKKTVFLLLVTPQWHIDGSHVATHTFIRFPWQDACRIANYIIAAQSVIGGGPIWGSDMHVFFYVCVSDLFTLLFLIMFLKFQPLLGVGGGALIGP